MIINQGRSSSGTFQHQVLGMNFRLTDLQCAVGVAQIKKYKKVRKLKLSNYNLYKKMLAALPESMFNLDGAWPTVRKKVDRSAKTWGEID